MRVQQTGLEVLTKRVSRAARRYPVLRPLAAWGGRAVWRLTSQARARRRSSRMLLSAEVGLPVREVAGFLWREELQDGSGTRMRNLWGEERSGDWDLAARPIEEHPVVDAVRDHLLAGRPWSSTRLHAAAKAALSNGDRLFKFLHPGDLEPRFEKIDGLIGDIRRVGYRSQRELGTNRPWDEVVIVVNRHGRPLLVDGVHRYAIARALGIPSIPAVVAVRHRQWALFCGEVVGYARDKGGHAYQPYDHFDLRGVPHSHGDARWIAMAPHIPERGGAALDIGANAGYFSRRLELEGFEVVAVERSEREAYFLQRLRDAGGLSFDVLRASFSDLPPGSRDFQVGLALSVFHHALKTRAGFEELVRFLKTTRFEHLFFEPHDPSEVQMREAFLNPDQDEFARLVADAAGMTFRERIAVPGSSRPIYHLTNRGCAYCADGEGGGSE